MTELIVDSFAGGGGASTGIELALGRSPDIAINHDAIAMAMHRINHPATMHIPHDVWKVDPATVCHGRPVGLLWASPDCKHFSKAKGGKPVEKSIRDLAWVIVKWAKAVAPRVIMMENVEEFKTWGPLGADNRPCKIRKGEEFARFIAALTALGYAVEWRELRACDYGAPTIRKRLFLIARRDGRPIMWPVPTHGDPKSDAVKARRLLPWRTAAEIIDWSLPCHSIFLTKEEGRAVGVKRPLAPATMARIAKGVKRYVIDAKEPFIVTMSHSTHPHAPRSTGEPMRTLTGAHDGHGLVMPTVAGPFVAGVGGRMGQTEPRDVRQPAQTMTAKADSVLVAPVITYAQHGGAVRSPAEPLHTVTASRKDANVVVAPTLIQIGYGEREGQEPRVPGLDKPLGTVVAGGIKHGLVAAHLSTNRNAQKPFNEADKPTHVVTAGGAHLNLVAAHLTKFHNDSAGASLNDPAPTVTANSFIDRPGGCAPIGVVAASLSSLYSERREDDPRFADLREPLPTATSSSRHALVAAFLAQHNVSRGGEQNPGRDARDPVSTVLQSGSHQAVVSAGLLNMRGTADDQLMPRPVEAPAATVSAQGGHQAAVSAFLTKAHGTGGQHQDARDPLHTVDCKDRFAAVTVDIKGEPYIIADIGMRMLTPRELFRAQGFPDSYIIDRGLHVEVTGEGGERAGRLVPRPISKTEQVSKCGNSVCPPLACALVLANVPELAAERAAA